MYQFDVKIAFLHGELLEYVNVDQPLSYEKGGREKGYKLRKALYDLRLSQGPSITKLKHTSVKRTLKSALLNIHCL